MAVSVVSFSFSRVAQPEAQRPSSLLSDGFLYCILSATSLDPNSIRSPRAPSTWCGFPYYISSLTPTVWLLVLTELYNSSTPPQSPTQSLEWHVWSSSSGNNCHAVHRSLSSGASVYECAIGFFLPCPISSAKFRLRDFFRLLAIGMCHFLPVHHFGMTYLLGSKVKIQHDDTNYNWYVRYCHQKIGTGIGGLWNIRTNGDHPNDSMINIGCNTENNPWNLRRRTVTLTPGENYQLTLVWKTE